MVLQSNPHGLRMPPRSTALLVAAVVACVWAVGLIAMDFVVAAVVVGAISVVCAVLGVGARRRHAGPGGDGTR